jgi:hypothetical protein
MAQGLPAVPLLVLDQNSISVNEEAELVCTIQPLQTLKLNVTQVVLKNMP